MRFTPDGRVVWLVVRSKETGAVLKEQSFADYKQAKKARMGIEVSFDYEEVKVAIEYLRVGEIPKAEPKPSTHS